IARDEDLNLATLYQHYTDNLLQLRSAESIPPNERLFFVEELAWEMQNTNRLTVPWSEFPARVVAHFGLKDDAGKAAFFERDIRTQSYLIRDDDGNYRFAHKSLMEFFVARQLSRRLSAGEATECPLTDAIVSFVHYLLAASYRYEQRTEGDMVWVPPGPFVFGWEKQSNLRVAVLEQGCWMDRYPVTNDQFCSFLLKEGNGEEGGEWWLDHERSRIQKANSGFAVKKGYGRHPVTGVSWYGAVAFAAWARKRLPTEQEWEKAARGIDGRRWPWGETFASERCNTSESRIQDTTEVGIYGAPGRSVYGCEDMAGNVLEWTESVWSSDDAARVARGGSWGYFHGFAACAYRDFIEPRFRIYSIGFRCART
ncbi:MAG: SUMF1/EgtB/PvdO family nonheme iron enzyme, partial [Bryobacteraceae bacterium]|nr:SUMF1/EgtB/PvdO family nonheme iron enzyme [Bryobacteraceae bacterium]